MTISRPAYGNLSIADALKTNWAGFHVSEKVDGCWHQLEIGNSVIVGELVKDGRFFAFDCPVYQGEDIRHRPTAERFAMLDSFRLLRATTPHTSESPAQFLQRILAEGGEGIVGRRLDSPFWDSPIKVKGVATYDCTVSDVGGGQLSIGLAYQGSDAGRCPCRDLATLDSLKVNDVVEICAAGRHPSGKFREARFLRIRRDKGESK